ncbi:MAG: MarC family protein [Verrucomicrobiia bacterium]
MSWNELLFDFVTLWVTVDPLGTMPLYLSVTKHMAAPARRRAAIRATIIAFFLLAGFLYFGEMLLGVMHIELLSFQIAGGIVLFLFSLTMIFEKASGPVPPPEAGHDVAVFPLAMPSIATPGALLSVVVLTDNNTTSLLQETLTCAIMALVLGITLILMLLSDRIIRVIGKSGANILSRLMGLILSAVAVQMVYSAFHGELGPG